MIPTNRDQAEGSKQDMCLVRSLMRMMYASENFRKAHINAFFKPFRLQFHIFQKNVFTAKLCVFKIQRWQIVYFF